MDRHGNLATKDREEHLSTRIRRIDPVDAGELLYKKPVYSIKPQDYERNQQIDAAYEYIHGKYKAGQSKPDLMMKAAGIGFFIGVILTLTAIYIVGKFS